MLYNLHYPLSFLMIPVLPNSRSDVSGFLSPTATPRLSSRANYRLPNVIFTCFHTPPSSSTSALHSATLSFPLTALLSPSLRLSLPSLPLSFPGSASLSLVLSKLCKWTPPLGPWGKLRAGKEKEDGSICQNGRRTEGRAVLMDWVITCPEKQDEM